jgi:hypothetical protein
MIVKFGLVLAPDLMAINHFVYNKLGVEMIKVYELLLGYIKVLWFLNPP